MTSFAIKQGETMLLAINMADDNGVPIDISQLAISAQVRDGRANLIEALSVMLGAETGTGILQANDTANWPTGRLLCDVKLSLGSLAVATETFAIFVSSGVTQ